MKHLGCKRANVFKPVCPCAKQYDCHFEFRQVLLRRQFSIESDERIEFFLGENKEFTILNASPAFPRHSHHFMADEIAREPAIYAFVEQDLH